MKSRHGKPDYGSLLHHAADSGSIEVLDFLLQYGLDVIEKTSKDEKTVLGIAAGNGYPDVVEYLLNTCSDDDILGLGADPIVKAGRGGSIDIFNRLVNVGFDPMDEKFGLTPLHTALKNGKEELAFYIIEKYPNSIHMVGQNGRSALHYASEGGSVALLKYLIDIGMDTRKADKNVSTILHIACKFGRKDVVMFLIEHTNILHMKDKRDRSALHYASEGGNVDIFRYLVTAGLNVCDRDSGWENMLHRACVHKNHNMIDYLLANYTWGFIEQDKSGWYPFHYAASRGDEGVLRLFMKHKIDLRKLSLQGESVLHVSCLEANFHTTQFILSQFRCLIPLKDKHGMTAMRQAVKANAFDIILLFYQNDSYNQ